MTLADPLRKQFLFHASLTTGPLDYLKVMSYEFLSATFWTTNMSSLFEQHDAVGAEAILVLDIKVHQQPEAAHSDQRLPQLLQRVWASAPPTSSMDFTG